MKPWHWGVAGVVLGLLLGWVVQGDPSAETERLRAEVAVAREQSRIADSLLAVDSARIDSLARMADALSADTLRLAGLVRSASQGHAAAQQAAREARTALAAAQTLADSVPALVAALGAETRRAEAAEATLGATRDQLTGTARLLAIKDSTIGLQDDMITTLRADRDRWRSTTDSAMTVIGKLERRRGGLLPALGRGAETAAVGAATVEACRQSIGSVGCLAGGVVTVVRLAKTVT